MTLYERCLKLRKDTDAVVKVKRGGGSIRPVVIVELGGVVLAVAALHSDTTGQDGSHIVAKVIPFLLLTLGLHLTQVET